MTVRAAGKPQVGDRPVKRELIRNLAAYWERECRRRNRIVGIDIAAVVHLARQAHHGRLGEDSDRDIINIES